MHLTTGNIMLSPAEEALQTASKLYKLRLYKDALAHAKDARRLLDETHNSLMHEGGSGYVDSTFGSLRFRIEMTIAACHTAGGNAQYLGIPAYGELVCDNSQDQRAAACLGQGVSHLLAFLHEDERPGSLILARDTLIDGRRTQEMAPGFTNQLAARLLSVLAQVHLLLDDPNTAMRFAQDSEEFFGFGQHPRRIANQFIIADVHRRRGDWQQMWSWRGHGLMQSLRLANTLATRLAACRMYFAWRGTARMAPLKTELLP